MIVDYVRVYSQPLPALEGSHFVTPYSTWVSYKIINAQTGCKYNWSVPPGASIFSGQDTRWILVNFGKWKGGYISCIMSSCKCSDDRTFNMYVGINECFWTSQRILQCGILSAVCLLLLTCAYRCCKGGQQKPYQSICSSIRSSVHSDEGLSLIDKRKDFSLSSRDPEAETDNTN